MKVGCRRSRQSFFHDVPTFPDHQNLQIAILGLVVKATSSLSVSCVFTRVGIFCILLTNCIVLSELVKVTGFIVVIKAILTEGNLKLRARMPENLTAQAVKGILWEIGDDG